MLLPFASPVEVVFPGKSVNKYLKFNDPMHYVTSRSRRTLHSINQYEHPPTLDEPAISRRLMSDLDRSKLGIEGKDGSVPPLQFQRAMLRKGSLAPLGKKKGAAWQIKRDRSGGLHDLNVQEYRVYRDIIREEYNGRRDQINDTTIRQIQGSPMAKMMLNNSKTFKNREAEPRSERRTKSCIMKYENSYDGDSYDESKGYYGGWSDF